MTWLEQRRAFLIAPFAFAGLVGLSSRRGESVAPTGETVELMGFTPNGTPAGRKKYPRVHRSIGDWKSQLSAQQFHVTRKAGTDTPFTGTYYKLHKPGLFRCVCCETVLFRSQEKFDSGTGWPSFWAPAAQENIRERTDVSMLLERTEVSCARCDSHLGHVFPDGPEPTHLRYCINESSLMFMNIA